jgi:flagellar basal body rod protein FlgG
MSSLDSIALSGMNAAMKSAEVAGHDLANLETAGFHRQLASTAQAVDAGGVEVHLSTAALQGSAPEADLVGLKTASTAFSLDAAVLRTAKSMTRALLDEQA